MRGGKLRHKVVLQKKAGGKSGSGITSSDWIDVDSFFASIAPLRGREYFQAASDVSEVTTRIGTRYRAGIKPDMRIVHGSRIFDIKSVIDVNERHRELELMCEEVVPGG